MLKRSLHHSRDECTLSFFQILETLLLITRDGEYSHIALKNVLDKYQYLEKRERAFITRVVEGTLEHQIEIDYIINHTIFTTTLLHFN